MNFTQVCVLGVCLSLLMLSPVFGDSWSHLESFADEYEFIRVEKKDFKNCTMKRKREWRRKSASMEIYEVASMDRYSEFTSPDGLAPRFRLLVPDVDQFAGLCLCLHGECFVLLGSELVHREWGSSKLDAFIGLGKMGGLIVEGLLDRGVVVVAPENCWGDGWHGMGEWRKDPFPVIEGQGAGLRRGWYIQGRKLALLALRYALADERFADIPEDKFFAWGTSMGSLGVSELIVEASSSPIKKFVLDSNGDDMLAGIGGKSWVRELKDPAKVKAAIEYCFESSRYDYNDSSSLALFISEERGDVPDIYHVYYRKDALLPQPIFDRLHDALEDYADGLGLRNRGRGPCRFDIRDEHLTVKTMNAFGHVVTNWATPAVTTDVVNWLVR